MRHRRGWWVAGLFAAAVTAGCQSADKYDPSVKLPEEWKSVPNEERYSHPDERAWKPPPKKEFKPGAGPGGGGMGGGGMGGPGSPGF